MWFDVLGNSLILRFSILWNFLRLMTHPWCLFSWCCPLEVFLWTTSRHTAFIGFLFGSWSYRICEAARVKYFELYLRETLTWGRKIFLLVQNFFYQETIELLQVSLNMNAIALPDRWPIGLAASTSFMPLLRRILTPNPKMENGVFVFREWFYRYCFLWSLNGLLGLSNFALTTRSLDFFLRNRNSFSYFAKHLNYNWKVVRFHVR